MRAYTVTAELPAGKGEDEEGKSFLKYAGTQSEAADIKRELWDDYRETSLKRNDIKIDEIEIPTDKKGLIEWVNKNAANA